MDPVSLILTALAAGAAAALKDSATAAVKDAYAGLSALVKKKLSGKPAVEMAVDEYASDPEVWRKPLEKALTEAEAQKDQELLRAAEALLAGVDPDGTAGGKYRITISGGKGFVIGDHNTATMTFNEGS